MTFLIARCKIVRGLGTVSYKSKHFNWNVIEWKATKFESFQYKIVQMGDLQKFQNSIQSLKILWPVYPIFIFVEQTCR